MKQILKRLELIKTAISIEDEEIIELQVMKLTSIDCDNEIKIILEKITDKDYGNVILDIENYLQRYSGVIVYEDKELQGLRLELKALEKKLQDLSSEKDEYFNDIHEFNVQYHLHLGALLKEILNLKENILFASIQEKKDTFENSKNEYDTLKEEYKDLKSQTKAKEEELEEMDEFDDNYDELYDELQELKEQLNQKEQELNEKRKETKQAKEAFEEDEATQEYEDVKQDNDEFNKEYEEVQKEDRFEITEEEKKELKKLYRKASKLCHPDIVSDELKEQAHEIMQKLNEAYSKRDLNAVKEILFSLESGKGFEVSSDTIDDKELLKSKIIDLRDLINENEKDIKTIKENDVIKILESYDDIEDYFNDIKINLEHEYEKLQKIFEDIMKTPEKESTLAEPTDREYNESEYKSTTVLAREHNLVIKFFIAYLEKNDYLYRGIDNNLSIGIKGEAVNAKYRTHAGAIWVIWPPNSLDDVIKEFKNESIMNTAYEYEHDIDDNVDDEFWNSDF